MIFNTVDNIRGDIRQFFAEHFEEIVDPLNVSTGRKLFVHGSEKGQYDAIMAARNNDFNHQYIYRQIASLKNQGVFNSLVSKAGFFS